MTVNEPKDRIDPNDPANEAIVDLSLAIQPGEV
jgi:hypothetical protein